MNCELNYLHAFACDCRVGEGFWCRESAETGEKMCSTVVEVLSRITGMRSEPCEDCGAELGEKADICQD